VAMAESKTNTLASSGAVPAEGSEAAPANSPARSPTRSPTMDDRHSSIPGPGSLIDNKYRVQELLARGGMGVVYSAVHNVSGKRAALKWMLPALGQIKGARERFMQEACATARIAHPNIVDIYDVGSEQGSAYLVMEYLRGETLADRMCRQRLPVIDAIALLMPALRGVAAAHNHGVIHRDLKPENIFLCCTEHGDELEPKVLDFGISKITTDQVRDLALTHSGAVLGTPYYMSPEQVRGSRDVDQRADVYALGVILFEALTGERPFDAETYNELILKIATEPLPSIAMLNPDLDPRLIAIVERAMARDPKERFSDVKQLALALEPFAGGVRFRSMQTLHPHASLSGDYPVGTATPTRPSPDAPPAATSLPAVAVTAPPPPRGRAAVTTTFVALLTCAGAAVYFLNHPDLHPDLPMLPAAQVEHHAATSGEPVVLPKPAPAPAPVEPPRVDSPLGNKPNAVSIVVPESQVLVPLAAEVPPAHTPAAVSGAAISPMLVAPALGSLHAIKPSGTTFKRSSRGLKPPTPEALPEPVHVSTPTPPVNAKPASGDWDKRLDQNTPQAPAVHMPAGRINMNDFR
jgi:eukaryotic-like serine/threonine-protein kinase